MATKKTEVTEIVTETAVTATAVTATEVAETPKKPEKVEVYIERAGANEDPNHLIGVNGKTYILPRGKTSLVPPEVAAEYERSKKAQRRLDETSDRLIELAKQPNNGVIL